MKQRIAFIVCGQPRHINMYEEFMSKIRFEFDHEIDFFFHFWNDSHDNKIVDTLKPKLYKFEPQIDFTDFVNNLNTKDKNISNYRPVSNYVSYAYSNQIAFGLKKEYEEKNNFVYDLVLRIRFDLFILNTLTFVESRLPIYKKNLNTADNIRFYPSDQSPKLLGLGDLFIFSNSNYMDLFLNLYDDITNAFNVAENNIILSSRDKHYCGESLLTYTLDQFLKRKSLAGIGLNIIKIPFLLRRSNYYKITQDFEYSFANSYKGIQTI